MGEKIDRHEIQGQVLVADVIPPIVIYGDGLCEVYPTIAVACQAVEAIDVKDGLYGAFESTGSPLLLVTHGNLVSIELPLDSTPDPAALERRLSDYIQEVGTDCAICCDGSARATQTDDSSEETRLGPTSLG